MEDKLMLETGIKGRQEVVVSDANSAKTMGSGTLDVFATPAMTALMEKTAWMSVADQLDEGCGTVGTLLNVTHDAPTPLGMTVWCETELVEVDGRRLVFDVAAYDAKGKIGGGRHERFIIQNAGISCRVVFLIPAVPALCMELRILSHFIRELFHTSLWRLYDHKSFKKLQHPPDCRLRSVFPHGSV